MNLYDPRTHRSLSYVYGEDPGVACGIFRAWCLWYLGYPEQAHECMGETVTRAETVSKTEDLIRSEIGAGVHPLEVWQKYGRF